jgi:hypothetical protein
MIYGDLGRFTIEIEIQIKIVSFWARHFSGKETKLSYFVVLCTSSIEENVHFVWIINLKEISDETGNSSIWINQIRIITKLPNSEQSNNGKDKTHKYINRQNQSTTENCENRNDPGLVQAFLKKWCVKSDFKAPNLPLSIWHKGSGCHYSNMYYSTGTKEVK